MGQSEEGNLLGPRALNRAMLARQLLLKRERLSALQAVEHLVGTQAQAPLAPYYGLWTRLEGFAPEALSACLTDRTAVRIALMRSTLHLVSSRDCLSLRPLMQAVYDRGLQGGHGKKLAGVDLARLEAVGRTMVEDGPKTFSELGASLRAIWPDCDAASLAAAVRTRVPLVQVPPRGLWGKGGQAKHVSAEAWLGRPLEKPAHPDEMVLRYLAAFGPASVKDMQTWSGLTRLSEAVDRLRPRLRVFRDTDGRELFDVPDGPLPDPDTPAPVRFLGEFDNVLLAYDVRTRIMADEYKARVFTENGIIRATILVDGFVRGLWRIETARKSATLLIEPFAALADRDRRDLADEGMRLLDFAAPDAIDRDIRFVES